MKWSTLKGLKETKIGEFRQTLLLKKNISPCNNGIQEEVGMQAQSCDRSSLQGVAQSLKGRGQTQFTILKFQLFFSFHLLKVENKIYQTSVLLTFIIYNANLALTTEYTSYLWFVCSNK